MKFKIALLVIAGLGSVLLEAGYKNVPLATTALSAALNGTVADWQNALKDFRESTPGIQNNAEVKKFVAQIEAKLRSAVQSPIVVPPAQKPVEVPPVVVVPPALPPRPADFPAVEAAAKQVGVAVKAVQDAAATAKLDATQKAAINTAVTVQILK